jgi:hypothetical protein
VGRVARFFQAALSAAASRRLIQIKASHGDCAVVCAPLNRGSETMTLETVIGMVAITIPFILFAAVLVWAEHQTRGLSH